MSAQSRSAWWETPRTHPPSASCFPKTSRWFWTRSCAPPAARPFSTGPLDALLQLARGAVLTPNIAEAELLLGGPADAGLLLAKGPCAVLLKGGHGAADPVDVLATPQGTTRFQASRIPGSRRGTGCRLASALAASLARGIPLLEAVPEAREYVRSYLQSP